MSVFVKKKKITLSHTHTREYMPSSVVNLSGIYHSLSIARLHSFLAKPPLITTVTEIIMTARILCASAEPRTYEVREGRMSRFIKEIHTWTDRSYNYFLRLDVRDFFFSFTSFFALVDDFNDFLSLYVFYSVMWKL